MDESTANRHEARFADGEDTIIVKDGYSLTWNMFGKPQEIARLWRDGEDKPFMSFRKVDEAAIYLKKILNGQAPK